MSEEERPKGRYLSKGESRADRKKAGQEQWAAWLTKAEHEAAERKRLALGVSKSELVRLALEAFVPKPK